MIDLVKRFLEYVAFDTQSDEESQSTPSTIKQLKIAQFITDELKDIGMTEVEIDSNGYVYATLPANTTNDVPTIGFIAHYDTSPDSSGANVNPRIEYDYQGGDIVLNPNMILSPTKFPELMNHIGEDIIVTDGNTLLGADDKAGIAEIVSACEYLIKHPEIKHGKVRVAFNPDEEIGRGAHKFDVEKFGCKFAYTMDGSEVGEIEYENFNAAMAKINIKGCSVHPGYAKGKMVNAAMVATNIVGLFPQSQTPQQTEGYEGFYHLVNIQGGCESASLAYIIRDHDRQLFENRKMFVKEIVETINNKYGNIVSLELIDQYYNMKDMVDPQIIDIAIDAVKQAGMKPVVKPIRGGTDGAQLSFMGLPCPNIFAGGINFHGPFEFCPIQSMEKAMKTIVNIITIVEQKMAD